MLETVETEAFGTVMVATITVKAAREAQLRSKTGNEFNDAFILAALKAGGHEDAEEIVDGLGLFTDHPIVQAAAMKVNGLKVPSKGEDQPAGPASTSSTSTEASLAGAATA
jgi:hypothetical protein